MTLIGVFIVLVLCSIGNTLSDINKTLTGIRHELYLKRPKKEKNDT